MTEDEDEDDVELAFELWEKLTDAQQDAKLAAACKEYSDFINSLNREQLYRFRRRRRLELIKGQRKLAKQFDFFAEKVKNTQKRLVEARLEYYHGQYTGHA